MDDPLPYLEPRLRQIYHLLVLGSGEGDGTPLQYSCLENPRDRGAWWAAVHGVAKSWTRLKRLSSSSSSICPEPNLANLLSVMRQKSYLGDCIGVGISYFKNYMRKL